MKPCINHATLIQTDVDVFLDAAASAGFKGVELRIEKLRPYLAANHSLEQVRQLLQDHGLKSVCFNSFEDFSHVPIADFETTLHRAREFLRICSDTDCDLFVLCPSPTPKDMSKDEALAVTADRIDRIAELAGDFSIRVGFEFVYGRSASTLGDAIKVLKGTRSPNVGLVVDTFHFHVGQSMMSSLENLPVDRLWAMHFNDAERGPLGQMTDQDRLLPGSGVIQLQEFARRLRERSWDGWLSVEMFRPEYWKRDPYKLANETMDALAPFL